MEALVAAEFPAVSRFLSEWKAGLSENGHVLSQSQIQFMDEFHRADATPYRALPWLLIVPGLVVAVVASGAILVDRRSAARHR